MAQRRAANIRERRRMFNLNEAFDKLRRKVCNYCTHLGACNTNFYFQERIVPTRKSFAAGNTFNIISFILLR